MNIGGFNTPKIQTELLKLIRDEYHRFSPPKVKQVILGLIYSGVRLANDQLGVSHSLVNFYTKDCFFTNSWGDLSSYSLPSLVDFFESKRIIDRVVGISAINAYSQHIFEKKSFEFDFKHDVLDKLQLQKSDKVGMVGLFKPMIPKILSKVKSLTIIENDPEKLGKFSGVEVIGDPSVLNDVEVAIITGTSIINNTIDDLLKLVKDARTAMIGPTMAMLPDPLFKAGVDVIGGMKFFDVDKVIDIISQGQGTMRFKRFAKKYIIEENKYRGL
ncbi:MAG: Rossmann-like domain-containing protein [Promethearchaeota archaeon]